MSWAQHAIESLLKGNTITIRPRGHSMSGRIEDGATVTIAPATRPHVGDIVLARVHGRDYLHLVKAVDGNRYLIGNNRGRINGWTRTIFGIVTKIG